MPQSSFSKDYFEARTRFRERVQTLGGRLESLPIDSKGPHDEDFSIDIAHFGAEQPRRALLHSSGLHGVEGFAGSAIQLQLLNELQALPNGTALVIAHILNPFGMAWLRRVNEANVDLNRNFLEGEPYSGAPETYAQCNSFLNPQTAAYCEMIDNNEAHWNSNRGRRHTGTQCCHSRHGGARQPTPD